MRNLIAATLVLVTGATTSIAGVVGKGDTVIFPRAQLNDSASVQTIEWKQNMSSRSEKYIQLTATDGTSVFVQPEMAGQVQQKCDANFCAFTVGKDFQYGQSADKTTRFLVLHDKKRKPFQHRFMENKTLEIAARGAQMAVDLGEGPATAFATASGVPVVLIPKGLRDQVMRNVGTTMKAVIGDDLRNF